MPNEVELKLSVEPHFVDFLRQEITHLRVLHTEKQVLGNCYYDTSDCALAKQKVGLRVRQHNGDYTLTLKTDGEVKGGLHIRPEYNVSLPNAQPNVQLLAAQSGLDLDKIAQLPLKPIFSTDFERQLWLVECGNGTLIEIAFDLGNIIAGDKRAPICEVEFELKSGKTHDLLRFVSTFTLENGVRLGSASKAKRGYLLASEQPLVPSDWLEKWRDFLQFAQHETDALQKLDALFQLEQALIEETFLVETEYFATDFLRTVAQIGAFFNLYHYYQDNGKLLEECVNQASSQYVRYDNTQVLADLLESNQQLFAQIRDIIRLHSETKDNVLALQRLKQVLKTGQYVKRMIQLISLTVSEL